MKLFPYCQYQPVSNSVDAENLEQQLEQSRSFEELTTKDRWLGIRTKNESDADLFEWEFRTMEDVQKKNDLAEGLWGKKDELCLEKRRWKGLDES